MNYRLVINQLGLLLLTLSTILLGMAAVFFGVESMLRHVVDPTARLSLLISGGIGLGIGGGAWLFTRGGSQSISRREAMLLVGLTWVLGAAFAALPFFLWANMSEIAPADHPFRNVADCYFEAMSGLTTTGASVLTDVEAMPRSLLLWRAVLHWLGGLGIVVLFVAVLPALGSSARKLMSAETSGVTKQGMMPQIKDTARLLWYIYLTLTMTQIILLRFAGMDWFDSVCHTFATLATGGFSTKNASIAAYQSPLIELICIAFMVLGGVNFSLYYQAMRGKFKSVYKDPELRLYLAMMLLGTVIIAALNYERPVVLMDGQTLEGTLVNSVRHSAFDVASMMTTTGFSTADHDQWHPAARMLLFVMVLIGGCAGSTSGGIKVIRLWIVLKTLYLQIERAFRPSVVRPIRIGDSTIGEDIMLASLAFISGYFVVLIVCSLALLWIEAGNGIDTETAISGVMACMSTTGPGLGKLGAIENYGWLSSLSKWVLSFAMLVGRLEVFTILVLFSPRFWRSR